VPRSRPSLPKIRGTQVGLRSWQVVDQIKADMLAGRFIFHEYSRIGGVRNRKGVYYVVEGHHRMVAAMEMYKESGDPTFLLELLRRGDWDNVPFTPVDGRPLPARDWWGAFRHWFGW
jgi:filamentous hemagglutinin